LFYWSEVLVLILRRHICLKKFEGFNLVHDRINAFHDLINLSLKFGVVQFLHSYASYN
jgi:hypothetical protein